MSSAVRLSVSLLVFAVFSGVARGDIQLQDTVAANTFWISQAQYVSAPGATSVRVTVEFIPGDRGYSGWVDFSTCGGTAIAGEDYVPAGGRLWFEGPGPRHFEVALMPNPAAGRERTIEVCLQNPDAVLTREQAEIVLRPAPPKLALKPGGDGAIEISWPASPVVFRLESAAEPSGPWSAVTEPASFENESLVVRQPLSEITRFFRLRQEAETQ